MDNTIMDSMVWLDRWHTKNMFEHQRNTLTTIVKAIALRHIKLKQITIDFTYKDLASGEISTVISIY